MLFPYVRERACIGGWPLERLAKIFAKERHEMDFLC